MPHVLKKILSEI
jgi:hypothetical protein